MTNHTPGPWWTAPEWPNCVFSLERHATPMIECNYARGDAEDIANARLIAAAPELLAALENLHDACERWNQEDPVLKSAREAITKARGGE